MINESNNSPLDLALIKAIEEAYQASAQLEEALLADLDEPGLSRAEIEERQEVARTTIRILGHLEMAKARRRGPS